MDSSQTPTKTIVALVVVVLLVVAATAAVMATGNKKNSTTTTSTNSVTSSTSSTSSSSTAGATNVKDGTYTATASYDTPGGVQDITVKLTVSGGTISDSSLSQNPTSREDEAYQVRFEADYRTGVVGKKISEVSLSRVGGASLTTDGFNSALSDIANQAKA